MTHCAMALESAKKSSRTFTDWTADLGDLVQTSPFVQTPKPVAAPKAGTATTDTAQLAIENTCKRLRGEIDKQMRANKKHKGGYHPFWHHTRACTVSSVETEPDLRRISAITASVKW